MASVYKFVLLVLLCRVHATSEQNVSPTKKFPINFYGVLETHQGNKFAVDNIAIENKYRQIPMYDRPELSNLPDAVPNKETGKLQIMLADNPANFTKTNIDLEECDEIQVDPNPTYAYQKGNYHATEFVHVVVIAKGGKTRHDYLMPEHTKLSCDEKNASGPIEKTVPLSAVKRLIIEGFSQRAENNTASAVVKNT